MSTPATMQDVVGMFGGGFAVANIEDTVRRVQETQAARVAFHAWQPLPNFSAKGTKFNLPYTRLERMSAILVPVLPVTLYEGDRSGFSTSPSLAMEHVVPRAGTTPKTVDQLPEQTIIDMVKAWSKVGLIELKSLAARNAEELLNSNLIFHALLNTPAEEDGVILSDLILEDIPKWLGARAELVLKNALDNGVEYANRKFTLPSDALQRGRLLVSEIRVSVGQAATAALNPNDGKLPKFKKLRNKAMNGHPDGRGYPTDEEEWLMRQFPSYPMDTDVERNTNALINANQNNPTNEALAAVLEQNAQMMSQNQQLMAQMAEQNAQNGEAIKLLAQLAANQQQSTGKGK